MANTTNYNWETPDDTDLVKDGAAAIRTLGNSIDTTTKALNPQTTLGDIAYRSATANTNTRLAIGSSGQVLTVAGGVPSWATPTTGDIEGVTAGTGISGGGTSGTVTITNSMATEITAKGDLIVGTGNATFDNLPVGTNGHILTADSTVSPTGLKWAAPASGSTFVGCSVYNSAAQTIANATYTAVTFNTENFDTDGFHSTSSNTSRITVPSGKGGYYLLVANTNWVQNSSGQRNNYFYKNGTKIYQQDFEQPGNLVYPGYGYSVITQGAVADYFEWYVYQDSGGNLNFRSERVNFQAYYLGA